LTENDLLKLKKFENPAAKSNYPIDIHSQQGKPGELIHLPQNEYYEIPIESLIPNEIKNLLVAGRSISSSFRAQASIRIQPNCWAMGESSGKYAADLILNK